MRSGGRTVHRLGAVKMADLPAEQELAARNVMDSAGQDLPWKR
jgi:hypothetical protein